MPTAQRTIARNSNQPGTDPYGTGPRARQAAPAMAVFSVLLMGSACATPFEETLPAVTPSEAAAAPNAGGAFPRLDSTYVEMRDGTKLAVDYWLPTDEVNAGRKVPTLLRITRYWRSTGLVNPTLEADSNFGRAEPVNAQGYAYVIVDARGSGASFGSRPQMFSGEEVEDYGEIADWIAEQPWSNGRVGTVGVSYDGTAAELTAVNQSPALHAAAPLFSDFSTYEQLVHPGNLSLGFFMKEWGSYVWDLDNNELCKSNFVAGADCDALKKTHTGVKPVSGAEDLLQEAVQEHRNNVPVGPATVGQDFIDDPFGPTPPGVWHQASPAFHLPELKSSSVPYYTFVSWLDAATIGGALDRFNALPNPQKVVIGATNHGGDLDADPFHQLSEKSPKAADPTREEQTALFMSFFDHYLKDSDQVTPLAREITYYTLGSGEWHTTTTWPPEGVTDTEFYLSQDGTLTDVPPQSEGGSDSYAVDYTATTGEHNRWHTNLDARPVSYPDRQNEDEKLLTYTTSPMTSDVEITGSAVIHLYASSNRADAAFFAYLEDVAPNGRVTYITEGQLRALSRGTSDNDSANFHAGPRRNFVRENASPLTPGKVSEITFPLWATSVLIEKGHRIRIALAGADDGNFDRYPADGSDTTLSVHHNQTYASHVVLPIMER